MPTYTPKNNLSPFLKWTGGKTRSLDFLIKRFPEPSEFNNYYEPFLGGGSVFYALLGNDWFRDKVVHLSDINGKLIKTHRYILGSEYVLHRIFGFLEILKNLHVDSKQEGAYYLARELHGVDDNYFQVARFIYLNKTCYNGLYRTRLDGKFNVPIGRYKNPSIYNEPAIFALRDAFTKSGIINTSVDSRLKHRSYVECTPCNGDFMYLDPPYYTGEPSAYTGYNGAAFDEADQLELVEWVNEQNKIGVQLAISQADTPKIRDCWKDLDFVIHETEVGRTQGGKGANRKKVGEILLTNY